MEELPSVEASEYGGEAKSSTFQEVYEHFESNRCVKSAAESGEVRLEFVAVEQGEDNIPQAVSSVADIDDNSRPDLSSKEDGERNYESEPVSAKKIDSQKKKGNRTLINHQGKTMFPRPQVVSKEMRELTRKHAILEKNLKIDGLKEPVPKFRKRRLSLSSNVGRSHDKDAPVYKRKRLVSVDARPKRDHMPKWELMGGDAHDPLNLNGLAHSEEGRLLNLKTPESSPLRTPDFRKIVYVKVPPNIEDPLNLEGKHDQSVIDKMLNSTVKKRHRSKKKKNEDNQQVVPESVSAMHLCTANSVEESVMEASVAQPEAEPVTEKAKEDPVTKTVDVVTTPTKLHVPIPTRSRSRSHSMSPERKFRRQLSGGKGKASSNEPKKFPEKPKFTLGNYNRYYGYRNQDSVADPRLHYFDLSWFKGKDVLDIGCNVGHITLAVAEHFHPHKILGMDIDGKLIQAARHNIRHMLSLRRKDSSKYPTVFEKTRGPAEAHPLMGLSDKFPNNVLFLQGNYVPGNEEILNLQKEEFDTILALSITKWIHLNSGDDGLKLFFQKIFRQLRPGGRLILEPQPWSTYRKRAKLTPEMFAKYQSIKLKPEGFKHYLLSIGFVKCEVVGVPVTKSRGFRRPLILFTKSDNRQTPNVVFEEVDLRDVCQECGNTNKSMCHHPQFTGMRRGPYASLMYDHFNYPYTSSDSPYVSSSRTYSNYSYSYNMPGGDDLTPLDGDRSSDMSGSLQDNSERGSSERSDSSSSSSGSRSLTSSSHSSSYESQSGSASSRSYSSSSVNGSDTPWSSCSSYLSPGPARVNGSISELIYNPNSARLNGDFAHEFNSPDHNGTNGECAPDDDDVCPELVELVDNVVEGGSPRLTGSSISEGQSSRHVTPPQDMDITNDNQISENVVQGDVEGHQVEDDNANEVPYSSGGGDRLVAEPMHITNSVDNDAPEEGQNQVELEPAHVSNSVDKDSPGGDHQVVPEAAYISTCIVKNSPKESDHQVAVVPENISNSVDETSKESGLRVKSETVYVSDSVEESDPRVKSQPVNVSDSVDESDPRVKSQIGNVSDSVEESDHRVKSQPVNVSDSVDDTPEGSHHRVKSQIGNVSDSVEESDPRVKLEPVYVSDCVEESDPRVKSQPVNVSDSVEESDSRVKSQPVYVSDSVEESDSRVKSQPVNVSDSVDDTLEVSHHRVNPEPANVSNFVDDTSKESDHGVKLEPVYVSDCVAESDPRVKSQPVYVSDSVDDTSEGSDHRVNPETADVSVNSDASEEGDHQLVELVNIPSSVNDDSAVNVVQLSDADNHDANLQTVIADSPADMST